MSVEDLEMLLKELKKSRESEARNSKSEDDFQTKSNKFKPFQTK